MAWCAIPHSHNSLPPAYETVVHPSIPLINIDFWPACINGEEKVKYAKFETFDKVLTKANKYISTNHHLILRNAETVLKTCLHTKDVNSGIMYTCKTKTGQTVCGLRIWVTEVTAKTPASELAYINLVPSRSSRHDSDQFQNLNDLIEAYNRKLLVEPLPGKLLSVDTVCLKIDKNLWIELEGNLNWDVCSWNEEYKSHFFCFLRIFYLKGLPTFEQIGVQDITPTRLQGKGNYHEPIYTSFNLVAQQAHVWMQDNLDNNKKLLNIQVRETPYFGSNMQAELGLSGNSHEVTKLPFCYKIYEFKRVFFMRIVYSITNSSSVTANNSKPFLTYRTFLPGRMPYGTNSEMRYQPISDLMKYVVSWLRAAKGVKVLCAETCFSKFQTLKQDGYEGSEITSSDGDYDTSDGIYPYRLMYFIRVYLDGKYTEPPPELLSEIPQLQNSDECVLI